MGEHSQQTASCPLGGSERLSRDTRRRGNESPSGPANGFPCRKRIAPLCRLQNMIEIERPALRLLQPESTQAQLSCWRRHGANGPAYRDSRLLPLPAVTELFSLPTRQLCQSHPHSPSRSQTAIWPAKPIAPFGADLPPLRMILALYLAFTIRKTIPEYAKPCEEGQQRSTGQSYNTCSQAFNSHTSRAIPEGICRCVPCP